MSGKRRSNKLRLLGLSVIVLVLLFAVMPLSLLIIVSDSDALVTKTAPVDVDSAVKARRIAKQFYRGLMRSPSASASKITLSEDDLNGIIALAARGISTLKGRVDITNSGLQGDFSLHVPRNPFGDYINVTANIAPSSDGLVVNKLIIGGLNLSGEFLLSMAESILNRALDDEALGTELLSSIESVAVDNSNITLVYHPIPNFRQKLAKLKGQIQFGQDDAELVRAYYQQLCRFQKDRVKRGYTPMSAYLSHIFAHAQQRSLQSDEPSEENRAALLALATFLGSEKFDTLIGALDNTSCKPARGYIGIANRNDLRLHFIFSAALQVMSSSGVSFSIGEFKELLDSQHGSSGFSFADLAADRAGIRFAELAVDDSAAEHLQTMATELANETVFFPSISGLPEGIHQQEFERRGGIESEFYKKYLATIEQRIDQLALYQGL